MTRRPAGAVAPRRARNRAGSTAMIALLSLPAMFGLGALTVDVGLLSLRYGEAQNVSDAAALGASMRLDGTWWGMYRARLTAQRVCSRNTIGGEKVTIDPWNDVTFGRVEKGAFVVESDPEYVTAVRVDIKNKPVQPLFSKAIRGDQPFHVSGNAVATGNDPVDPATIPYTLPFALPYCQFENIDNTKVQSMTASLDGSTPLQMYWTSVDWYPWPAVLDDVVGPLATDCLYSTAESLDSWACSPVTVGDWSMARKHESSSYQPVVSALVTAGVKVSDDTWDTTMWGTEPKLREKTLFKDVTKGMVISGPIMLVDNDYCATKTFPTWNQVVGYVWVSIYDATATPATATTAASSNVWARIDMTTVHLIGVGTSTGPEVGGGVLALGGTKLIQ